MLGWTFAWLAGTAAIAGYSITRHAPALERLMRDDVQEAIAPLVATTDGEAITVSVRDHVATLSGTVDDAAGRDALIATAGEGLGIRRVVDRLVVRASATASEPAPPTTTDARVESLAEELAAVTPDAVGDLPIDEADARASEEPPAEATDSPAAELPPDDAFEVDEADEEARDALPGEELLPEGEPELDQPAEATLVFEEPPAEEALELDEPSGEALALDEPPVEEPSPGDAPDPDTATGQERAVTDEVLDASDVVTAEIGPGGPSPTLRLDVVDRVLTIEGSLAKDDDAAALVLTAMDSFELDYVSNTLESGSDVPSADWLVPLADLLPSLALLDDPGVDVAGRQVTLYGTAPDAATRDAIVARALAGFGDYTLVERIDVGGTMEDGSTASPDAAQDSGAAIEAVVDAEAAEEDFPLEQDAAEADVVDSDPVDTDTPDVGMPDLDAPDLDTPDLDTPDLDAPDLDAPDLDAPDLDTPDLDTPDLDTPDLDTSETDEGADGADAVDPGIADPEPIETDLPDAERDEPDPTLASPVAALREALEDTLSDEKILFQSGSATLTEDSLDAVDRIAETLLDHPGIPIAIEGHTDGIGLREENLELSQRRANAVRDRLVERGVPFGRLTSYGYGEGVPIADNSSPEGRAANRRIEFTF